MKMLRFFDIEEREITQHMCPTTVSKSNHRRNHIETARGFFIQF